MVNKCRLPFERSNIMSYPHFALADSIYRANMGEAYNAYSCERFINCYFDISPINHMFAMHSTDNWGVASGLVTHQKLELYKESYVACGIDFVDAFKKFIICGCYIYGVRGDKHDKYMVSGFDNTKGHFLVWSFDSVRGLYLQEITYRDFIDTLFEVKTKEISIILWKYNPNNEYFLKLNTVESILSEYLKRGLTKTNKIFGLPAIEIMAQYIEKQVSIDKTIDVCCLYGFAEHKLFMFNRMKYLCQQSIVSQKYIKCAESVNELAQHVLNLALKYNNSGDLGYVRELVFDINHSVDMEQAYLPFVLADLRTAIQIGE